MDEYIVQMSQSFEDELTKIATAKAEAGKKLIKSWMLPAALATGTTAVALRANEDRKVGRRFRIQRG